MKTGRPEQQIMSQHAKLRTTDLASFLWLSAQLVAAVAFVWLYQLEEQFGLSSLLLIAIPTLIVQAFLPIAQRAMFLVAIFIVTCLWAFGLVSGGFILVVSLLIFLLADAPYPRWLRIAALAGIVTALFVLRTQLFFAPRAIIATPYIAAIFMFRLISYFQEPRKIRVKSPFFQRLGYFLLLPNLTFLLFPIIDYQKYIRSYYTRPAIEIYRTGAYRVFVGLLMIFSYRMIYQYASIPVEELNNPASYWAYVILSYSVVIRIVGMFLVSIGLITMSGYNLPPAFGNFFFASGFSDLWRRINIYWRDFVIKTSYLPIYFRLRGLEQYTRMFVAGMLAFGSSMLFHTYQLFWITGKVSLRNTDLIYWSAMGLLVTLDGMRQFSLIGRRRAESQPAVTTIIVSGLRITLVFMCGVILWNIWISDNFSAWLFVSRQANLMGGDWKVPAAIFTMAVLLAGVLHWLWKYRKVNSRKLIGQPGINLVFFLLIAPAIVLRLYAMQLPAGSAMATLSEKLSWQQLNDEDIELANDGYYGQVLNSGGMLSKKESGFRLLGDKRWGSADGLMTRTGNIYLRSFKPNMHVKHYNFNISTNGFGMRDQAYTRAKPEGTQRWIFMGGSYVTGFGVEDTETFEALLEKRLGDSIRSAGGRRLEILNFSCFGYGLIQQAALCRDSVFQFYPDRVFYFAHPDEPRYCAQMLSKFGMLKTNLAGYPELSAILNRAGIRQTQSRVEMISRLRPYGDAVVTSGYRNIVSACKKNGAVPVWVFLPTTTDHDTKARYRSLRKKASDAGFVCLDLSGVFDGQKLSDIQGGGIDSHPNRLGHKLIEQLLEREIRKNKLDDF